MAPDILLVGQITIDDTVPREPGPWQRRLGGNALYSVAGARLWCAPERIGVVARVASNLPFDVAGLLESAGMSSKGLTVTAEEALIEWILYEEDGNRQSLPRNHALRDPAADLQTLYARYLTHIGNLSASCEDIPAEWLPASSIHLAPQVRERHASGCRSLAEKTGFLSVDPSPHYSRGMTAADLRELLSGVTAFLPSQAEIEHMGAGFRDWHGVVDDLLAAGFPEVVMKRGAHGCIVVDQGSRQLEALPAARSSPVDLTGAGDAFSGAYAACRALGHTAKEAAECATVTAAMIIECSGTEEAFALVPEAAAQRLAEYRNH